MENDQKMSLDTSVQLELSAVLPANVSGIWEAAPSSSCRPRTNAMMGLSPGGPLPDMRRRSLGRDAETPNGEVTSFVRPVTQFRSVQKYPEVVSHAVRWKFHETSALIR